MNDYVFDRRKTLYTLTGLMLGRAPFAKGSPMDFRSIVLAGDSIIDNNAYVNGPGVVEQFRMSMPKSWMATKIAVDGDCIQHVRDRLENIPDHATDLILSVGGNDALGYAHLVQQLEKPADIQKLLLTPLARFRSEYSDLLDRLTDLELNLRVMTIYTQIPFPEDTWRQYVPVALSGFNQVIVEEAVKRNVAVLRIDQVCNEEADYSAVSPIEPSVQGGQKIVDLILSSLQSA